MIYISWATGLTTLFTHKIAVSHAYLRLTTEMVFKIARF